MKTLPCMQANTKIIIKDALMISFHWNIVFEQTPARLTPPVFLNSTLMIKAVGQF